MSGVYQWKQDASSVSISFHVPLAAQKQHIEVSITSSSLAAGIRTQPPILQVRGLVMIRLVRIVVVVCAELWNVEPHANRPRCGVAQQRCLGG
jgi:hypothetical protein